MADILKIENLRVHFKDAAPERFAVDGISFSIREGEMVGLVGESGIQRQHHPGRQGNIQLL